MSTPAYPGHVADKGHERYARMARTEEQRLRRELTYAAYALTNFPT